MWAINTMLVIFSLLFGIVVAMNTYISEETKACRAMNKEFIDWTCK